MDEFASLESDLSISIEESTSHSNRRAALQYFTPMYEVRPATEPKYNGSYRVGKTVDFDEMVEKYSGLSEKLREDSAHLRYESSHENGFGLLGWIIFSPFIVMFVALIAFTAIYAIPLLLICIPIYYCYKFFSVLSYKAGMFPGKLLTAVDHIYVHPNGKVTVPIGDRFEPFTLDVNANMKLVTHYHNGGWRSISMVRGHRQYFKLTGPSDYGLIDVNSITEFLNGFGLESQKRETFYSSDGGGSGGG